MSDTEKFDLFSDNEEINLFGEDENLDLFENPSKKYVKLKIGIILSMTLVTALIIFGLVSHFKQKEEILIQEVKIPKEGIVTSWLNDFIGKNYDSCDNLVTVGDEILLDSSEDFNLKLYKFTLDKLVSCIDSIKITSYKSGVYTVNVTLKPYIAIDFIDIDETSLNNEKVNYIKGTLSDKEMKSKIKELYKATLNDYCFQEDNKSISLDLVLEEDASLIKGSKAFINSLLEASNVKHNVDIYLASIHDEVKAVIDSKVDY